MHEFSNDEAGYITWITEHPFGYVVNSDNPPNPSYLMLHRADCRTINPDKARNTQNWTLTSFKARADRIDDLQQWARGQFGQRYDSLQLCESCENAKRL